MRWFVVLALCSGATLVRGGALRCVPGEDLSCLAEETEKDHPTQVAEEDGVRETTSMETKCTPGSEWDSNCDSCRCSEDGRAVCSRRDDCEPADVPELPVLVFGRECAAGSRWTSSCNSCSCSEDGHPSCTEHRCTSGYTEPVRQCAPDSLWRNECNTCWCAEDGRAACTRMSCPHDPSIDSSTKSEQSPEADEEILIIPTINEDNNKQATNTELFINFDETEHPDVEIEREKEQHSFEEIDYDVYESDNDLNHIHTIQEQDNLLEETDKRDKDERHVLLKRSMSDADLNQEEDNFLRRINQGENDGKRLAKQMKSNTYLSDSPMKIEQDSILRVVREDETASKHLSKRSVCVGGEVFQLECNACKCAADGRSYTCSHNECMEGEKNKEVEVFMESEGVDHIERHTVCAARSTFYIGCNTCHCNQLGTDYSCTNKPCPLPEDVELFHELKKMKWSPPARNSSKVCVANRMFIKDCNTCWCNEDGTSFYCTRRVCLDELPEENTDSKHEKLRTFKKTCRPNEVFEMDCNMCRCNPDGESYSCTRRACVDLDSLTQRPQTIHDVVKTTTLARKRRGAQQDARKTCVPGAEFRMDCNTCLCSDDGQDFSCTRNDCANNGGAVSSATARAKRDTSETVTMQCVAGSVFDRDCNVCRCTSDGQHAQCTTKPCVQPGPEDSTPPVSESNFRCNPGEQLKRGCNDCSCSADGRSVFCTVRFCDQDITPPPAE